MLYGHISAIQFWDFVEPLDKSEVIYCARIAAWSSHSAAHNRRLVRAETSLLKGFAVSQTWASASLGASASAAVAVSTTTAGAVMSRSSSDIEMSAATTSRCLFQEYLGKRDY